MKNKRNHIFNKDLFPVLVVSENGRWDLQIMFILELRQS